MSVNSLHTTKGAYFFRKAARITTAEINALFNQVIARRPGTNEVPPRTVKRRRTISGVNIAFSFLLFDFEEEPTFLKGTARRDRKHGYLLLLETGTHVAIFQRHVSSPDKSLGASIEDLPYGTLSKLFMSPTAEYGRIAIRNIAVSDHAIRAASYEAKNLKDSMPPIGAHSAILQSLKVHNNGEVHAITPGTARVAKTEPRSELANLLEWGVQVINHIVGFANPAGFIDNFARPLSLGNLPSGVHPNGILFLADALEAGIAEGSVSLVCNPPHGPPNAFSPALLSDFFDRCRSVMRVNNTTAGYEVIDEKGKQLAELRKNTNTFTLRSSRLDRVTVSDNDAGDVSLSRYINEQQQFVVTFTNPQYVYFSRQIFEDQRLLGHIPAFMSIFDDSFNFAGIDDEKGDLSAGRVNFEARSVFHLVENQAAKTADLVFCDDLGDEWADHICCWLAEPRFAMFHSKHGDVGLSASDFHIVVSQALKNLGRLNATRTEMLARINGKWAGHLGQTNIPRIRRSGGVLPNQICDQVMQVLGSPNCVREVVLVTSFISKAALQNELAQLAANNNNNPRIIQILWLISSFVSTCRGMGVRPRVICRA